MKKNVFEFLRRGLTACGFGPLVLAIIYLILQSQNIIEVVTVNEFCMGIFSLSALAFIAGGINFIYKFERLPLIIAILIHGTVLYFSYLATYLLNDWLEHGTTPIIVFSTIFVIGFIAIWAFIYFITKRNTKKLNEKLKKQNIK